MVTESPTDSRRIEELNNDLARYRQLVKALDMALWQVFMAVCPDENYHASTPEERAAFILDYLNRKHPSTDGSNLRPAL